MVGFVELEALTKDKQTRIKGHLDFVIELDFINSMFYCRFSNSFRIQRKLLLGFFNYGRFHIWAVQKMDPKISDIKEKKLITTGK